KIAFLRRPANMALRASGETWIGSRSLDRAEPRLDQVAAYDEAQYGVAAQITGNRILGHASDPRAAARELGFNGGEIVGRHRVQLLLRRKPRFDRADIVLGGQIAPGDEQYRQQNDDRQRQANSLHRRTAFPSKLMQRHRLKARATFASGQMLGAPGASSGEAMLEPSPVLHLMSRWWPGSTR